jgi:hypothetical protein
MFPPHPNVACLLALLVPDFSSVYSLLSNQGANRAQNSNLFDIIWPITWSFTEKHDKVLPWTDELSSCDR